MTSFFIKLKHFARLYSKKPNPTLATLLKNMPKDYTHIAEAQKQRKKIKEKLSKYVPGRVTLQVLGTGAKGAPASLFIFSDQSRYLFNCGEGTQRLAHEHKMKLSRLEHIFVTQAVWKNLGGLPGTALTIQDVGVPEITLHGPEGVEEIFNATRRFVVIRDLKIRTASCGEEDAFEDNVLKVKYVPLKKMVHSEDSRSSKEDKFDEEFLEDTTDYYAHEHSGQRVTPDFQTTKSLENLRKTEISMSYIVQLQPRPGALNLDKCVQLGIRPGPILGKLKSGEAVTLDDGRVVQPKDVCEPDDPGPIFIVIDCPDEDYLDSITNNSSFLKHQNNAAKPEDLASLVVHFSPEKIMKNVKYQDWMSKFSNETKHLVLNEANNCMGSLAVHKIQYQLNILSSDFFPLLETKILSDFVAPDQFSKKIKLENCEEMKQDSITKMENQIIYPNTFCNYYLRPHSGIDRSCELKLDSKSFIDEVMALEEFPKLLQELKSKITLRKQVQDFPQVVFLGTGSCIPNKTRNTSGILLRISPENNLIIDCGEGTAGQVIRLYGLEKAQEILSNVKAIYVSHLHADHHIGLIGILQEKQKALKKLQKPNCKTILFAPKQILSWLCFYNHFFEEIQHLYTLIPNSILTEEDPSLKPTFEDLDMHLIKTCFVKHCPNAFGVAITHKSGYKITYSGDTMPCQSLIEVGLNSDLLIHEATMEDELAHEATIKLHSTTSQAIEIGQKMKAKYTLLTHFSQRYAKLPRFNCNFSDNVAIAFDNMQIRLEDLHLVPLLYPALKVMFAEQYEELEHKAVKRQLKMDRQREASLTRK